MRRKKLENFVITGKFDGEKRKGRPRCKNLGGLLHDIIKNTDLIRNFSDLDGEL